MYYSNVNPYANGYYQPFPYYPQQQPAYDYSRSLMTNPYYSSNNQRVSGQATWTDGGQVTKCGIPWSDNRYMTAAVGENTPYQCGQTLKIRNLSIPGQREILVTIVDRVAGFPANKINLHRRAFEALGANPSLGVINVEIIPSPELEQERWGKYLLAVTKSAYPGYQVTDYISIGKTQVSPEQTRETFDFVLQSQQEQMKVRGTVLYNPQTDRVISFDLKEVPL